MQGAGCRRERERGLAPDGQPDGGDARERDGRAREDRVELAQHQDRVDDDDREPGVEEDDVAADDRAQRLAD